MERPLSPKGVVRRDVTSGVAGLGLLAIAPGRAAAAGATIVETEAGRLRGFATDGAVGFRGVPYGGDTSRRRFQPAGPPEPWTGVRDADDFGQQCPQPPGRGESALLASWTNPLPEGEDCLRLNLWTPSLGAGRRPVMVWLHGGGFTSGSGSSWGYDGARLAARHGVVVVSVTHRLNAFGHLYLKELGGEAFADSGNVGMLDIVQALQWVHDHIDRFGGDPSNVTVFGQSGGAGKVTVLMAMPAARGLFHRAIVESGSTGIGARTPAAATEDAVAFMDGLGLRPDQLETLRDLPAARLREGLTLLTRRRVGSTLPWGAFTRREWRPVVDGRSLPEHPFYPKGPAVSAGVPLLVGTAKDECRLHLGAADAHAFTIGWDELAPRLAAAMGQDPAEAIAFYRDRFPSLSASDLLFKIFTFWRWRYSAIWQAERKADQKAAPAFVYRVDWETPVDGGKWRAPHTIEIPFVFDNVAKSASLLGAAPTAQHMADLMSATWVAFARDGRPRAPDLGAWPAYDPTTRKTLRFDLHSTLAADLEGEERRFFSNAPPRLPA